MDEPLSNLDAKLRVQTRTQIASLQRRLGVTTVYVTHDQVEAMTMGDRVAVLLDGILQQVDAPRRMYDKPANVFVAGFIGSPAMNLCTVRGRGRCTSAGPTCGCPGAGGRRRRCHPVGHRRRPSGGHGRGRRGRMPTEVEVVEELGADAYVYGSTEFDGERKSVIVRVDGRRPPAKGDVLYLAPRAGHVHMFAGDSGERIEI